MTPIVWLVLLASLNSNAGYVHAQVCSAGSTMPSNTQDENSAYKTTFPYYSSFIQIFQWMTSTCQGNISTVSFGCDASSASRKFYLGIFQNFTLEGVMYFNVINFQLISPIICQQDGWQQIPINPPMTIYPGQCLGFAYDTWNESQSNLVIRYKSYGTGGVAVATYTTYVGKISAVELSTVSSIASGRRRRQGTLSQLRVGSELDGQPDAREPAMSVSLSGVSTTTSTTTQTTPRLVTTTTPPTTTTPTTTTPTTTTRKRTTPGETHPPTTTTTTRRTTTTTTMAMIVTTPMTQQTMKTTSTQPGPPGQCGPPPARPNALVINPPNSNKPTGGVYATGSFVQYGCMSGYTAVTDTYSTCQIDGTWSPLVTCLGSCGKPPNEIAFGTIDTMTFTNCSSVVGDVVTYRCSAGYDFLPPSLNKVICMTNQQWSDLPTCVQQTRVTPTPCPPGQSPIVDDQGDAQCVASLSGCGPPQDIPNGYVVATSMQWGQLGQGGDQVSYACAVNFAMIGEPTVMCNGTSNQWSVAPVCVETCGPPPNVVGGVVLAQSFDGDSSVAGSWVRYGCLIGLTLLNSSVVTCGIGGIWSTPPACQYGGLIITACGDPPEINNGTMISRSYTTTLTAWYDTVTYACDAGFHLQGGPQLAEITCLTNGTWMVSPSCVRDSTCEFAPDLYHGYIVGQNFKGQLSEPRSWVRYACDDGYTLRGPEKVLCGPDEADGLLQWSQLPACDETNCGEAPAVKNGYILKRTYQGPVGHDGDRVTYACSVGYHIHGVTATIVCLHDGTWTQRPTCEEKVSQLSKSCGPPPYLPNGAIQSASFDYTRGASKGGDTAIYLCNPRYVLQPANPVVTCDNITMIWIGLPQCLLGCGAPPAVTEGKINFQSFTGVNSIVGSTAQYQCADGYSLYGDDTLTCGPDGTWQGTTPTCSQRSATSSSCGDAPSIINGQISNRSMRSGQATPGDIVRYSCQNGYNLQGRPEVACLNDGTWSSLPTCLTPARNSDSGPSQSARTCGDAPYIANGALQSVSYHGLRRSAPGDTATYRCNAGFRMTGGSSVAKCDMNSLAWTGVPNCLRQQTGTLIGELAQSPQVAKKSSHNNDNLP